MKVVEPCGCAPLVDANGNLRVAPCPEHAHGPVVRMNDCIMKPAAHHPIH